MHDVAGMEVEEAFEDLVHEILVVLFNQFLRRVYHFEQVSVHQLSDEVDIFELLSIRRRQWQSYKFQDIGMFAEAKKLDFADYSSRIFQRLKSPSYFLNGDLLLSLYIQHGSHYSIHSCSYSLDELVPLVHAECRA